MRIAIKVCTHGFIHANKRKAKRSVVVLRKKNNLKEVATVIQKKRRTKNGRRVGKDNEKNMWRGKEKEEYEQSDSNRNEAQGTSFFLFPMPFFFFFFFATPRPRACHISPTSAAGTWKTEPRLERRLVRGEELARRGADWGANQPLHALLHLTHTRHGSMYSCRWLRGRTHALPRRRSRSARTARRWVDPAHPAANRTPLRP